MIKPVSLTESILYTCKEDRKSDVPTRWPFRSLTIAEESFLKELSLKAIQQSDQMALIMEKNSRIYLDVALEKPENWDGVWERNTDKKAVFNDIKPLSDKTLQQIPYEIRSELVSFVVRGYLEASEDELKN